MNYEYIGTELDLFSRAVHWKTYFSRLIEPYLGDDVLEVGAGLGGTTKFCCSGKQERWVCLEPDSEIAALLDDSIRNGMLPPCCRAVVGTLATVQLPQFDTLLYIDVLEHIEDDREELTRAARQLKPGGHVVVLSPAHPWLYTPFDRAIGHYRRYTKSSLKAVAGDELQLVRLMYLDAVGLLASLGNRVILRKAMPTARQIEIWDRVMVRLSKFFDPLLGYQLGKSVIAIWKKRLDQ